MSEKTYTEEEAAHIAARRGLPRFVKLALRQEGLSKKEKRKLEKEMSDFLDKIMFERIAGKYIPLYTKAFAEARAMQVPAHMEKKKTELIDGQEERFNQLKAMREAYLADKAKKASGAKADDDKDGREDKDDDADDDDGDKMVEAARIHPKFRLPRPEDAKLETDYSVNGRDS